MERRTHKRTVLLKKCPYCGDGITVTITAGKDEAPREAWIDSYNFLILQYIEHHQIEHEEEVIKI